MSIQRKSDSVVRECACLLALSVFFSAGSFGAVVLTSAPIVDAITYSSARFSWATDQPSTTYIKFGLSTAYGQTAQGDPSGAIAPQKYHAWFLSGLAPGTTYHAAVCSSDGTETCSTDLVFTTLPAPVPVPQNPELPRAQVDTTMPVQTGDVLTVGDCDDPQTGLVARWQQAQWGDTVVIPPSVVCTGSYNFPAKAPDPAVPHR
jgi:hypothetical protein